LIKKIGQDLVDKIEADQDSRNYSIEDLQRITLIYRKRKRIHADIRKNKNNSQ
jgi:hypothetical protein